MVEHECFSPQIEKQEVLIKQRVIDDEEIKEVMISVLKNGFSHYTVGIVDVVQVHNVHLVCLPGVDDSGLLIFRYGLLA